MCTFSRSPEWKDRKVAYRKFWQGPDQKHGPFGGNVAPAIQRYMALARRERELGLNFWDAEAPSIDGLHFTMCPVQNTRLLTMAGRDPSTGAPFYRLVDFTASLTDAERAGLEAALQASGLLDAVTEMRSRVFEDAQLKLP